MNMCMYVCVCLCVSASMCETQRLTVTDGTFEGLRDLVEKMKKFFGLFFFNVGFHVCLGTTFDGFERLSLAQSCRGPCHAGK